MIYPKNQRGFTLIELLVSIGITAVLMVGISTFFSSTFRNMFMAREQFANTQGQFVLNTILRGKFVNIKGVDTSLSNICTDDCEVILNDTSKGDLPFTLILEDGNRIKFKDFFVFNGKEFTYDSINTTPVKNPGGLTTIGADVYVTAPLEGKIYKCNPWPNLCSPFISDLDRPMDITTNGSALFFTDAGSGKVYDVANLGGIPSVTEIELTEKLNQPSGIAFYDPGLSYPFLFVSDTYNNVVRRIEIAEVGPFAADIVVGAGNDESCTGTALFCKLNFPTGLVIGDDGTGEALYIADTGNDRIIKMADPGPPANNGNFEQISFTFGGEYAIEKVGFKTFINESFQNSTMTDSLNATYDNVSHEMTPDVLFSAHDNVGQCGWSLDGTSLYIDPAVLDISIVEVGDIISVEGDTYEVMAKTVSRLVCDDGGEPATILDRAHRITVNKPLVGVSNGSDIYFGSMDQAVETIDLSFIDTSFATSGFQAIDIDVYEFGNILPVETHQHYVRVGDGILGTSEDVASIVNEQSTTPAGPYNYPTGLSFVGNELRVFSESQYDLSFDSYDYISDFEVQGFDLTKLNGDTVLELEFQAKIKDDDQGDPVWETYTLNAKLIP